GHIMDMSAATTRVGRAWEVKGPALSPALRRMEGHSHRVILAADDRANLPVLRGLAPGRHGEPADEQRESKGAGAAAQIVRHDVILAPLPDEALNRAFAPRQNSFKGDRRGLRLAIVPGRTSRTDHKRNFMRKTLLAS